jgi:hypothetical protein
MAVMPAMRPVPTGAVFGPAVNAGMVALEYHCFERLDQCRCGYKPDGSEDWDEHVVAAVIDAVAVWLETHTSDTLSGDPFLRAADWAAQRLRVGAVLPEPGPGSGTAVL